MVELAGSFMSLINLLELPNGVYRVEKNKITRMQGINPLDNEKMLVFFLNKRCIHCLALTPEIEGLIKYLDRERKKTTIVLVLCDWFTEECKDENAKKLFEEYNVDSTPTILLLEKKGDYIDKMYIEAYGLHEIRSLL